MDNIEKMSDFFTSRVEGYDEHMLEEVDGCREGYIKMAKLLPDFTKELLDLGCGTGLELDEIFKLKPEISVTGIDLTEAMLLKLKEKHPDKKLKLINASYVDCDLGANKYDAAVSFQTMHHLSYEVKLKIYKSIFDSLKDNGTYIECDYMLVNQEEEDFYFSESKRIRSEQGISEGEFYHYDTPCTVDNQLVLLKKAGFKNVYMNWRKGNTTMVVAEK